MMRKLSIAAPKIKEKGSRYLVLLVFEIISVILLIIIGILDIIYQNEATYRASIALNQINADFSYSDKKRAVRALISIYLLCHIYCLWKHKKYWVFLYFSNLAYLFFLSHEALTFEFIGCFNYTNNRLVETRSILCIFFVVFLIVLNVIALRNKDNYRTSTKHKTILALVFLLALAGFICAIALNIIVLINLKPNLKFDISAKNIKLGYFTEQEIQEITNLNYTKTVDFDERIFTSLDKIIKSKSKSKLEICDDLEEVCTLYDSVEYTAEILCTDKNRNVYPDCMNADKLLIKIDYTDVIEHPLPYYNCAQVYGDKCVKGCLSDKFYTLLMVQDNVYDGKVELAWYGLCNCEIKEPDVVLNKNFNIDPCS